MTHLRLCGNSPWRLIKCRKFRKVGKRRRGPPVQFLYATIFHAAALQPVARRGAKACVTSGALVLHLFLFAGTMTDREAPGADPASGRSSTL